MRKLLLILVLAIAGFAVYVATRPSAFTIVRSATLAASPAAVFAQVASFKNWEPWSPWAKLDPNMKQTYEGPAAGPGAIYTWSGNGDVGAGRMTVLDVKPNESIRIKLEFLEPFAATNTTEFMFKPEGDKTAVTWSMSGENGFMAKAMGVFMNMDKMIGDDFVKGLTQLGEVVAKK
jgi:uncharacterized protein YndB with AHSA1/START domain